MMVAKKALWKIIYKFPSFLLHIKYTVLIAIRSLRTKLNFITKISTASARFIHIGLVKHATYFILLFIKTKILRFLKHLSVMTQTFAHIIRHLHLEKKHLRHQKKSQLPKQLWYIPYGPILSNNTGDGKGPIYFKHIYFKHTYFNLIYGDALPQCLIMRSGIK